MHSQKNQSNLGLTLSSSRPGKFVFTSWVVVIMTSGAFKSLSSDQDGDVPKTTPRFFKGIVHPKMKILSLITHLHVVPNP